VENIVEQLVLVTAYGDRAGALTEELTRDGFYVTQVDSSGGFLHEAAVSLLVGLGRDRLPGLLERIRACCHVRRQFVPTQVEAPLVELRSVMIEAEVGGAAIYVLPVERFEQL
jgi:uncharacterized protein YaaQ